MESPGSRPRGDVKYETAWDPGGLGWAGGGISLDVESPGESSGEGRGGERGAWAAATEMRTLRSGLEEEAWGERLKGSSRRKPGEWVPAKSRDGRV